MTQSWRYLSWYEPNDNILKFEAWFRLDAIPCEGGCYRKGKIKVVNVYRDAWGNKNNKTAREMLEYLQTPQSYVIHTSNGDKQINRPPVLVYVKSENRTYWKNIDGYSYRQIDLDVYRYLVENKLDGKSLRLYCYCEAMLQGNSFDLIAQDVSVVWGHHEKSSVTTDIGKCGIQLRDLGLIRFNDLNKSVQGCYRKVYKVARSKQDIKQNLQDEYELNNNLREPRTVTPHQLQVQNEYEKNINNYVDWVKQGIHTIDSVPEQYRNAVRSRL